MGCDGGTIPKRDELVKTKKKPEQKDKNAERAFRWKHCAISQQPLQPPVVSCELGRLYSKESVLETLLNKAIEGTPLIAAHIRNLKDVKELQLTENPAWNAASASNAEVGDGYIDSQKSQWVCPISGQEMNGMFKFCFIWTCGCVLSDKALKELRKGGSAEATSECLKCQKPFNFDDVIIINTTDEEDKKRQAERMANRRAMAKKNKKGSKKREAEETESSDTNGTTDKVKVKEESSTSSSSSSTPTPNARRGEPSSSRSNGDSSTIPSKKSKLSADASAAKAAAIASDSSKKLTNYSVAKDPKASEAYKSLFTSHETAQNQQKAHWVTYNPFYN